ncbi:MAG: ROK family protein [Saprospiraceae bacterium]
MGPSWGISLGESKIEGIVLADSASRQVLRRMRIPTELDKGYYHVLGQIHKLVEVLSAEVGVRPDKIGVACRGSIDPITKTLKGSGWEAMNDKPMLTDLQTYLGVPIKMANDANCFALAEARFGEVLEILPAAKTVVGVIVGSGVGAGIVINGRILNGRQGIAGEWGHNYLDDAGGKCSCGRFGCVETMISGPALERYYESLTHRQLDLDEIAEAAESGNDEAAAKTIERLVYHFAKAISPMINILDPDAIVLGGAVGKTGALLQKAPELIKRFIFNKRLDTLVLAPKLGANATVLGAAML